MRRWLIPLLVAAVALSATFLYRVKSESDAAAARARALEAAIAQEEEAARLLEAEIAARSRPERLRAAAEALGLEPPEPSDIVAPAITPAKDDGDGR